MKIILVFILSTVTAIILGLMIAIPFISVLDQWCLYKPWYLLFKNMSIYMILIFGIPILLQINNKITRPAVVAGCKSTIKTSLYTLQVFTLVAYFYFTWFYGNPGSGACSKPNLNVDYYKYPGQDMYITSQQNTR